MKRFPKFSSIFLALAVAGGAGYYFGENGSGSFFDGGQKSSEFVKKQSVKKPKNLLRKKFENGNTISRPREKYTFFEVLNDPGMETIVELKIKGSEPPGDSKAKRPEGEEKRGGEGFALSSATLQPVEEKRVYTVQVDSFQDLAGAGNLEHYLIKKGYSAFVATSESPRDGKASHRVFMGKFGAYESAQKAAENLKREENLPGTVILISE